MYVYFRRTTRMLVGEETNRRKGRKRKEKRRKEKGSKEKGRKMKIL